jgi:hypothetical protein
MDVNKREESRTPKIFLVFCKLLTATGENNLNWQRIHPLWWKRGTIILVKFILNYLLHKLCYLQTKSLSNTLDSSKPHFPKK